MKTQIFKHFVIILVLLIGFKNVQGQLEGEAWLMNLLMEKGSPTLKHILKYPDSFRYQIIYSQINRDKKNNPKIVNYSIHLNNQSYFNPASTVKLPTALMALEKINSLKSYGIDKYSHILTDSSYHSQTKVLADSSSKDGYPSIAQYCKKIFLVSDNDAYNRLYEFVGQSDLNQGLWKKGYTNTKIVRRFVSMNEEENRHTNQIHFVNEKNEVLYQQKSQRSNLVFDFPNSILIGKGYINKNDSLINQPFDFTRHNHFPLAESQKMLQSVLFPNTVAKSARFHLSEEDRNFLLTYLSKYPEESRFPNYDSTEFFQSYTKFFMFKSDKKRIPSNIRIFNKPGWSYGFLTDIALLVDFDKKVEFMLSATIYVNRDGVINDDKYEYQELGYPFFKEIGEIIYQYELERKRKFLPNLSRFQVSYQ